MNRQRTIIAMRKAAMTVARISARARAEGRMDEATHEEILRAVAELKSLADADQASGS